MILLEACYENKMKKGHVVHNVEEKAFDTIPKLNSDIILIISYVNIGFDSETMIANQVWGFSPKESWIEIDIDAPVNFKNAFLKLKVETDPGSWRLDRETPWKAHYNPKTQWFCVGSLDLEVDDQCIVFLENAISVLNSSGELKALWIHL